jgi:hypothetical protein
VDSPRRSGRIVQTTDSRTILASVHEGARVRPPARERGAKAWTPLFVVASPRPQVGKTFVARLVTDFLRLNGGIAKAFDLNPNETALADFLPLVTSKADIGSTQGQMALFDRLIVDDGVPKVVDLSHALFERFFALTKEIGFIEEAARRALEPVILFAADPHPASSRAYLDLQERFADALVVPVFNHAILKGRRLRDMFPFARAAAVPLQIPLLPPALKLHADQTTRSFADFHSQLPVEIPIGHAFELRSWTKRAFLEFRELELRVLLEKLRASLKS